MRIDLASRRLPWVLAVAVWLLSVLLSLGAGLTDRLENILHDWNLRSLADRSVPDSRVVLLDIDEPTLEAMAPEYGRYPWSRAVFGQLLEGLSAQEPAAVIFDILFIEPHKEHLADDRYLIRMAQQLPYVYFASARLAADPEVERARGIRLSEVRGLVRGPNATDDARASMLVPMPGLRDTGRIASINIIPDADGVIRRYPLFLDANGWRLPSMAARVTQSLGITSPPGDSFALAWRGRGFSFETISFVDVFSDVLRRKPERPRDEFTGRIIIVGSSATGLHDLKLTPMGLNYPGPEIIATALDNLINGERIRELPTWTGPAITALCLLVLVLAFGAGLGTVPLGALSLALSVAAIGGSWAALVYGRTAVPVVNAVVFGSWFYYLLMAVRSYWLERRDRQHVTAMFSRFLDPRVVAGLVDQGAAENMLKGQWREVTVLFSDIRGFTTLSERKTAPEIVDILNRYFARQVEVVFRHEGTLDKFIGDAIMAFWGAPTEQPDHAARALAAAREMEQVLLEFRKEMGADGEAFDIGIGLNTGKAVVGMIGSPERRLDYTVIGDAVNTSSRIEGATKDRARILVSDATRRAVGDVCEFRDHGEVKLKGKGDAVHLYEPVWRNTP